MKKIVLVLLMVVLFAAPALGAGSCTQNAAPFLAGDMLKVTLKCTGDSGDGSIPNTAISAVNMNMITGKYYLYTVSAYPTSGGPAPDAADVFILDANGEDLLGSADGGTTPNKGSNLIHATLKKTTFPYSYYSSQSYFPAIINALTLKVSNQGTASAKYTIELLFAR